MNAPLVKLGDVCEVVRARIPIAQLTEETYISTDNMLQRRKGVTKVDKLPLKGTAVRFRPGDVLLSNIRPYLQKLWLAEREGGASSDIIVFRPKPECAPAYLFHALSQEAFFDYVMLNPSGTKMPRGRREWIARFAFPLPPLAEQERIVAHLEQTLGAIDAMEAKFREMAETAERHFRATLAEAFAALSSAPVAKLGEVCEVRAGANQRAVEDPNGAFPIYGSGGKIGYANAWRCPANTVLVGRKGTLNNPMLIPEPLWNIDTAFGLIASEKVLPAFLHRFCQSVDFEKLVPDSGRPSTTATSIRNLDLPLPSLAEQERVVAHLERTLGAIDAMEAKFREGVAQCGVYRRAVLSEAFGGGEGGGDE